MYQENLCLLANAPNADNARLFMEFMLRPEIAAQNAVRLTNGPVNLVAIDLLPEELQSNASINPSPEVRAQLQIFEDVGRDLRLYTRAWDRIKTN